MGPQHGEGSDDGVKMFFWPIWTKRRLAAEDDQQKLYKEITESIDALEGLQGDDVRRKAIEKLQEPIAMVEDSDKANEFMVRLAHAGADLVQTDANGEKKFFWPIWTARMGAPDLDDNVVDTPASSTATTTAAATGEASATGDAAATGEASATGEAEAPGGN